MKIFINDPSRIIGADLAFTIRRGIFSRTPTLKTQLLGIIRSKTAMDTGALRADEQGTFNTEYARDNELVHVFTGFENQLETWGRAYAWFIEGPELGEQSWTITKNGDYSHMFQDTADTNGDVVAAWGLVGIQKGISDIVSGKSLRL